jgi:hypothetical protein
MALRDEIRALEAKLVARQGKPGWADSVAVIQRLIDEKKAELRNGG